MKRITLLLSFLILVITHGVAQDLPAEVNVIPPSPSVMSINKFVDIPVSHYTGTPNISVPIYELKLNQLSLPIGLSYHASGLKVEEHASWVGAGWALNAGGNINRTIRGLPDEFLPTGSTTNKGRKGFFHNHKMFDSSGNIVYSTSTCDEDLVPEEGSGVPYSTLDSLSRGLLDTEADLYTFSTPGGSGKFLFTRAGGIVRLSSDDVKITDHPFDGIIPAFTGLASATDYEWTIQGPDGVIYEFSSPERTSTSSLCGAGISAYDDAVNNVQSSWHLDKIKIGDEWIQFHYVDETLNYGIRTSSSGRFKVSGALNISDTFSDCLNTQNVTAKRLEKITTSNGFEVKFIASTADRLDLAGSKNLERIEVSKDGNDVIIYNLAQAYFGNSDKLKLLSVKQTNGTTELPGYTFDYDATHSFPTMSSKSQDLWGYYNGKTNGNLISQFKTYASFVNGGADRSTSLTHAKVGTLNKLTYPTGGHTSFDYELHDYYEVNGNHEIAVSATASGGTILNPATDTENFTVSSATSLSFFVQSTTTVGGPVAIGPGPQIDPTGSYVEFRKHDGTSYVKHALTQVVGGNRYVLPAGDYQLYVHNEENAEDFIRVEFEQTENFQGASSGLRVKEITTHDPTTGKDLIKRVEYVQSGSTNSSGVLFTPPLLGGTEVIHTAGTVSGSACTNGLSATMLTVSSVSQLPASVYQGGHIGYSRVIESQVDPDNLTAFYPNGNTVFEFINDKGAQNHAFPYVPQEDVGFKNGKLLTQLVNENESNVLKKVSETVNTYATIVGTALVKGMKVGKIKTSDCYSCDGGDYSVNLYTIRNTWHRLESTLVKAYDDNHDDSKVFENTVSYTYQTTPNHHLPISQTTTDSEGLDLKTSFGRDLSHPVLITSAINTRDGAAIGSQKFTYQGNSPLMISRQEVDPSPPGGQPVISPVIPVVKYTYGPQNTILESHQFPAGESSTYDRGITTSFIWGYGNAHPIAQVVNAGKDDVAFSSFEAGHKGNWTYTVDNKLNDGVTGSRHHLLTGNSISKGQLTLGTKYMVSFWAKGGTVTVSGTVKSRDAIHGAPGDWQYYEKVVTGVTTVTISGTAKIDELRLHPLNAEMTSFVYDPGVGRLSEMSANGISTHYIYDDYNRLQQILDRDGNILKYFDYSYQITIN